MKWFVPVGGVWVLFLIANSAPAQLFKPILGVPVSGEPSCCLPHKVLPDCSRPPTAPTPDQPNPMGSGAPTTPRPEQTAPTQPNAQPDVNAEAANRGTNPVASSDPGLFGDLNCVCTRVGGFAVAPTQPSTAPGSGSGTVTPPSGGAGAPPAGLGGARGTLPGQVPLGSGNRLLVVAPLPARAAFKITENESPLPLDRVFATYNYYNDVDSQHLGAARSDLHRETIGFEKTFLNGGASFGLRLPFEQLTGSSDLAESKVADLTLIFKYAFIHNRATGNVLSGGLAITAPTGQSTLVNGEPRFNSTGFQPFVGFIYNFNRNLFAEGFSSVFAPTDARDTTLFFNSVSVGYHLLRNRDPGAFLQDIVPVAEWHVNTPLNHRGSFSQPVGFPDTVDCTTGCHFVFRRATAGIAIGTPLTGPRPFQFEVMANVNIRF